MSGNALEIFGKLTSFEKILIAVIGPVVFIFITLTVCISHPRRPRSSNIILTHGGYNEVSITIGGRDEEILRSYPKFLYSEAKRQKADCSSNCSICLDEYGDADMLPLLSDCSHIFYQECVDPWLMLHPTCPVCRNSRPSTALTK